MRGLGLRALLDDIQSVLRAGGGSNQAKALSQLSDALKGRETQSVDDISAAVQTAVQNGTAPLSQQHLVRIKSAKLDERLFLHAFRTLEQDQRIKKADLISISKALDLKIDKKATLEKLLDGIKGQFYERLYEHDADEMAKRARPW